MARGRRQKKSRPKPLLIGERGHLSLRLTAVEITRGHDGFLRGDPEPVLLFAAYAAGAGQVFLIERALRRLRVTTPFPAAVTIEEPVLWRAPVPRTHSRVALLALALEEDRGTDIAACYAELSRPEQLYLYGLGTPLPEPRSIEDLAGEPPTSPPVASQVQVLRDGAELAASCGQDQWVGAALVLLATDQPCPRDWRLPFLSADGRNDWTARLSVGG